MPAKSAKQERFMQAVAHNPAFAKKAGVPQSVGKEFTKSPKKFGAGGLYENIHAKRERIAEGSGEKMRSPGSKGAPTAKDFKDSAKTAKKFGVGGKIKSWLLAEDLKPQAAPKEEPKKEEPKKEEPKSILKQGDTLSNPFKKMIEGAGSPPPPEKKAKGGPVKESKKMIGKELSFMKKKGAPKSMIKHEAAEMGAMKKGGKVAKYARGGGIEVKGKTRGKMC